jgi:glycosyltransferase involved in cell wall biosynthesis
MVRELIAAGWECHVVVPAPRRPRLGVRPLRSGTAPAGPPRLAERYEEAGAKLHLLPMRHLTGSGSPARWLAYAAGWPLTVGRLARLGRHIGADVVHTNSLHSWYGWAAARLLRRPHIWHAREIVFQSAAALRLERTLARRFADRVVAVSEAVAGQLDPANLVVVRDSPDPDRFGPGRAGRFRARVGIADDARLVGWVGRFDTWKGLDTVLDAFGAVADARPGTELVVAGAPVPGKEAAADQLRRRAATMAGVHWVGWRDDTGDLMADLDLLVAVSTQPEPFGLVVVEALACGVPVVAGTAGGPLEVLGPEAAERAVPAGRLVTPGDPKALVAAILEVLPPGASSAAERRCRSPLVPAGGTRLAAVFDALLP